MPAFRVGDPGSNPGRGNLIRVRIPDPLTSSGRYLTLKLPALATLNETEEKKLAASGADNNRAIIHATTIALCRRLTSLFRRSNSEWLVLVCKTLIATVLLGFDANLA
jgi:hypothetical protein